MIQKRPGAGGGNRGANPPNNVSGGGNRGSNLPIRGGSGGSGSPTSPWLNPEHIPTPHATASFVEYLRWMRVRTGRSENDSRTLLELLSKIDNSTYVPALNRLNARTKKLADVSFEAKSSWRIRVGGTKGPESILLPAFDALGLPYIPGSSLRGAARSLASRDLCDAELNQIFGAVEPQSSMGQVVFLDAYPQPGSMNKGGLKPDMANAIWTWSGEEPPTYRTNPNTFLSLEKPTFIIGLRKGINCTDSTFQRVQQWLENALAQGIGSQVNAGYGGFISDKYQEQVILDVPFRLEGQFIHGRQKYIPNGRPEPEAEIRPTAFRGILRYWFRSLALGVLQPREARDLEMQIFGGIQPEPHTGMVRLEILDQSNVEPRNPTRNDPCIGTARLLLRNSSQTIRLSEQKQQALAKLLQRLAWLMFHLGGVGQGARRPCYSRANRTNPKPPWWRGSLLVSESEDAYWKLPEGLEDFQKLLIQRLRDFYASLGLFRGTPIDCLKTTLRVAALPETWIEEVNKECQILVVSGSKIGEKPYALAELHSSELNPQIPNYNRNLCGAVHGGEPIPSPIWIADFEDCQVVTVFGATANPRKQYIENLRKRGTLFQVWPLQ